MIKTRERIVKNNTKLHKQGNTGGEADVKEEDAREMLPDDTAPRDQGFTRPKASAQYRDGN